MTFIENYVDGIPNASYSDEDRVTRYEYVNGLRTSYILEKTSGEGQQSTYDAWGNLVRVEVASTNDLVLELRRDVLSRIISQNVDGV